VEKLWETCEQVASVHWTGWPVSAMIVAFWELVVNIAERSNDILRAVHQLRQRGVAVGYPMQTASGEIIFGIGKDFTLTAGQILDLFDRGDLHLEGILKLIEAQAEKPRKSAAPMRKQARLVP
jgi:hypothetical protein